METTGDKLKGRTLLGDQDNKSDGEISGSESDSSNHWEGIHENIHGDEDDDDDGHDGGGDVSSKNNTYEIKCIDGYF